jgi:predicted phosphoribosyltransferase
VSPAPTNTTSTPKSSNAAAKWPRKPANRVVKPRAPAWFGGVGQFYRHFEQVEDEEVVDILKKFA